MLTVGKDVLWSLKDLSMDGWCGDYYRVQQCFVTMDGCNNLGKKRISCQDEDLLEFFYEKVNEVEELGGMQNGFCDKRLIWKCVIPQTMLHNVLLKVLDMTFKMKKEVKTKQRQDMTTKKTINFGSKLGTGGTNE